jgi:hypothetical protein
MDKDLSVYPDQAIQEIQELIRKAIDYGNRIVQWGTGDPIDRAIAERELDKAILSFIVLLEQYPDKHGTLLEDAKNLLTSSRAKPLQVEVLEGQAYLIWPFKLRDLVDMFSSLHIPKNETKSDKDVDSLVGILNRSEYYITQTDIFGSVPRSENDVHTRIEGLLRCFYSDIQTKTRISKTIKNFEPDTEIPSLKALIEYKYITNRAQGKTTVDQVLADMSGYQSPDRDNIIFVIYETRRVFPKADWDRMIKSCRPQNRIECVVIKGVSYAKKATS